MLKDITIGQYFPKDSIIHRLDPRTKIIITFIYIIALFLIREFTGYLFVLAYVGLAITLSKVPARYVLKGLKPLAIIIGITVIINMLLTPGIEIFRWGPIKVTMEGVRLAGFMALRLIFLVVGTSLLTLTTSPIALTDGIEFTMKYIPFLRRYSHELAMMMTIALRFIPTLIEETEKIMKAQMARGADFESGGLLKRAKSLIPLLVPLFLSAFRRADELAMAMEARCYRGGKNRTRMTQLQMDSGDYLAFIILVFFVIIIIWSRWR